MTEDTTQFQLLRKHLDALCEQLPDGAVLNPAVRIMSELAKIEEAAERMAQCLDRSAKQFSFYECNHRDKMPPDTAKADVNHQYAVKCYEALTCWRMTK